jgi:SAM-dependent methyltransferase
MKKEQFYLVHPVVKNYYNDSFADNQSDKKYPSLDLVRLEKWYFGGTGKGRILEYGFGTGTNMLHLLECGYHVDGVDAAPNALTRTNQRLQKREDLDDRATLTVINGDDVSLNFQNDSFDFVNCMNVLSLLAHKERIHLLLREFSRVMKKGAKVLLDINGQQSNFAQFGKYQGDNIYLYGETDMPVYCSKTKEEFSAIVEKFFIVDDIGYTEYCYQNNHVEEFIICAHK